MPVKNDSCILFFLDGQSSVMVRVQQLQDFLASLFSAITFKCLDIDIGGILFTEARGELNFTVD